MASRAQIEITVEGVEEARRALEQILRDTSDSAIPQALDTIGQQWVTEIARRAPLKTGRLRRSYTWEVGRARGARYVEVSSNVLYAPFQEFGTRYIVGTPHVRPGTQAVTPQVPKLIVEGVSRSRAGFRGGMGGSFGGGQRLGRQISRLGALGG
jgi:hypothetical protein